MITVHTTCYNIKTLRILPTERNYQFHMILLINSDYNPKQNHCIDFCNGDMLGFISGGT
jgi:hypothetical protein